MVTAPLLTVGVQVDLPESNADSLQSDNEPLEAVSYTHLTLPTNREV